MTKTSKNLSENSVEGRKESRKTPKRTREVKHNKKSCQAKKKQNDTRQIRQK